MFVVEGLGGAKTLTGTIKVEGAKNAILKVLAASVLFKDELTVTNVPAIEDVARMFEVLEDLGVKVEKLKEGTYRLIPANISKHEITPDISKKMRSSIVLTGPLLARFGKVSFPHPGGCVIGKRPIDIFLESFRKMGATIKEKDSMYLLSAPNNKLEGVEVFMKKQSVTVTETLIMAAILAKGKTVLKNCALEPEIISLAEFLISCGAKIKGLGTPTLEIQGGSLLSGKGKKYVTMPDRIEAGSFIVLAALAGKDVTVSGCEPKHLDALLDMLELAGVAMEVGKNSVRVFDKKKIYTALDVKTHEYPGFPTDLQAPLAILLTQAEGESFIFETIFEGRLNYLEALNFMGANTRLIDAHRAIVYGPTPLKGREMESPDLRAGLAYLLAAIIAKGTSTVKNAYYIDRGYENIEGRLRELGVKIERVRE